MTLLLGESPVRQTAGRGGSSSRPGPRASRQRWPILAVLLLSIALSPLWTAPVEAKGLDWVKVCGPLDCTRTAGEDLDFERQPLIFPPWVMSGRPDPPPDEAGRWLRVRVRIDSRRMRSVVLPRAGYAGGAQGGGHGFVWQRLDDAERRTYLSLGHGLRRFPASSLPGLAAAGRDRLAIAKLAGTARSIALGAQPRVSDV